MDWLVFSYSLPKSRSGPRVAVWRRLRRLGAISLAGGSHVLPAREESIEAFQWLAQEIRQAKGQALVMRVEQFEGLADQDLIQMFNLARAADYQGLDAAVAQIENQTGARRTVERGARKDAIAKLRKRQAEIARVDYFDCPEGIRLGGRIARIEQALLQTGTESPGIPAATRTRYLGKTWVTRPHPHVDRLACAWLIRRFIDPRAVIRYSTRPPADAICFDMADAEFGHQGNLCTFETMIRAFGLEEPALGAMAEIIHSIDLQDGRYTRNETEGIDAVLRGWTQAGLEDSECEARGITLFEGLYNALAGEARVQRKESKSQRMSGRQTTR